MVEFKQIVGRGTRLFQGKDHFTVFDFVDAHNHFQDPEWDGEPLAPEGASDGDGSGEGASNDDDDGIREPATACYLCSNDPCVCDQPSQKIVRVSLSNGKTRDIDSMIKTSFWSPSGTPISADEFIQQLFGDLPEFFSNEETLREIWSLPDTRKKLLQELQDKGYTDTQLEDLRAVVRGEDTDLFDVLSYVAYHKDMVPRLERAEKAMLYFDSYNKQQQKFLNFVLEQYVKEGVSELDDAKLKDLLTLKYNAIADAKNELGDIASIRNTFISFQKYLYVKKAG